MLKTPSMQQLLEAGVHFGHQVRRGDPQMRQYIYGVRDGVHIINLELSEQLLKAAAEYAYRLGEEGKVLLFIGTKKQAQPIVTEAAKNIKAPYLANRWVGGFLTNFEELRKNISKLNSLRSQQEKGELSRYTKKEQLLISRKLQKFGIILGGVAQLDKLPDAIFITDAVSEKTAIKEASGVGIKIIAITDTNANPSSVDYPIPGNDDASKSLQLLVETIALSYGAGLKSGDKIVASAKSDTGKKAEEKIDVEAVVAPIADEVAAAEEEVEKKQLKDAERVV